MYVSGVRTGAAAQGEDAGAHATRAAAIREPFKSSPLFM